MKKWLIYATLIASVAFARSANASETTVHIMNRDPKTNISFLYSPGVVRVAPGDTVNWVSTNTMHNVTFVSGGVPSGVPQFTSGFQTLISYKFSKPGIYFYKCGPHFALGMVGVVVVGNDRSNLAALSNLDLPMAAKQRLNSFVGELMK
jgi:pseudoazurin